MNFPLNSFNTIKMGSQLPSLQVPIVDKCSWITFRNHRPIHYKSVLHYTYAASVKTSQSATAFEGCYTFSLKLQTYYIYCILIRCDYKLSASYPHHTSQIAKLGPQNIQAYCTSKQTYNGILLLTNVNITCFKCS